MEPPNSDSIENVFKYYQENYNATYNNKSTLDIFSEFFGYDLNAIDTWIHNQLKWKVSKNNTTSAAYRKEGNLFFIKRNLQQSLQFYTKSLCYASPLSEEYSLALGNRSAVTFETENYEGCLRDIDLCLVSNYPEELKPKILLRKAECLKKLKRLEDLISYLDETCIFFNNLPLVDQDKYVEKLNKLRVFDEVVDTEQNIPTEAICGPSNFENEENSEFAYASSKIEIRYSPINGRHVVAKQNILKGDILFQEKAFSFSPIFDVETRDINTKMCYHCLKDTVCGIPCDSCVRCIFCDKTCKDLSWEEYHKWECVGMQSDMWYHLGIALPAFKTLCKGISSNVSEVHDSYTKSMSCFGNKINNYPYFDSLIYHICKNDIGTLICSATVVEYLSKYTFFFQSYLSQPNCPEQDLHSLKKHVGSRIAKHILQLENNSTVIEHWINMTDGLPSQKIPVACGIFPSVSIMNHSCRPNITNYFMGDTIVVKALMNIEHNTEIFNCYGIDYRTMRREERRKYCRELYNFECKCDICTDFTKEMEMFDSFICIKCRYDISDHDERKFSRCGNCKSKIDLSRLREMNANVGTILEGETDEEALLRCLNHRKQFLSGKHTDLQDSYYKLYQFYAKNADFHNLMKYFEMWMENEKTRIGANAQKFVHVLYEIGSLIVKNFKTDEIGSENEKELLLKANIMLNEAKTISSLYYPDCFIKKIKWE